jgi:hypothetical protein
MTRTMGSMVINDIPTRGCRGRRRRLTVFPVDSGHVGWTEEQVLLDGMMGVQWGYIISKLFPRGQVNLRSTGPDFPVPERRLRMSTNLRPSLIESVHHLTAPRAAPMTEHAGSTLRPYSPSEARAANTGVLSALQNAYYTSDGEGFWLILAVGHMFHTVPPCAAEAPPPFLCSSCIMNGRR